MKLHPVELTALVTHSGTRTFCGMSNGNKALRQRFYKVGMAHPANTFAWKPYKQNILCGKHGGFAVFTAVFCRSDLTSRHIRHQLNTITDAENRDA